MPSLSYVRPSPVSFMTWQRRMAELGGTISPLGVLVFSPEAPTKFLLCTRKEAGRQTLTARRLG